MLTRFPACLVTGALVAIGAGLLPHAAAQWRVDARFGGRERSARVSIDVLTRGPVHEAYAQFAEVEVAEPIAIAQEPPPPLDELPPDETVVTVSGDDEPEWIPGYWSWDDDRGDYIWTSGVWRVPPPGCTWVPGYWTRTGRGYEYTAGMWLDDDDDDEIEYLPAPPRPLDEPESPPPSPMHVWVPGCWYWEANFGWDVNHYRDPQTGREVRVYQKREAGYVWRPGYWVLSRPDWVWTPASYTWTPRGFVFVAGHWDYPLQRRGVLFAPVGFERPVASGRHIRYTPSVVIDVDVVVQHMFTRSRSSQYYFGDYYAVEYQRGGYRPWFEFSVGVRHADPLFVQTRSRYVRVDSGWDARLRRDFDLRTRNVELRPARTYRVQETHVTRIRSERRGDDDDVRRITLAKPLAALSSSDSTVRTRSISDARRSELTQRGDQVKAFQERRRGWESTGAVVRRDAKSGDPQPGGDSDARGSQRVRIDRSPIGGRTSRTKANAPEPNSETPEPKRIRRAQPDDSKDKDNEKAGDDGRKIRRIKRGKDDDKP